MEGGGSDSGGGCSVSFSSASNDNSFGLKKIFSKLVRVLVLIDTSISCRSTHTKDSEGLFETDTKDQKVLTRVDRQAPACIDRHTPLAKTVFLKKLPKLECPGKLTVPCSIVGVKLDNYLCDTGSSVNIMLMNIAMRLGICDIKGSPVDITLVDASVKTSTGLVENLHVKIGYCLLPCDFHVVEMANDTHMPLILGRPFLATAGALVDLPSSRISQKHVDPSMFYGAISSDCALLSPNVAIDELDKVCNQEVNHIHPRKFTAKKSKDVVKKRPQRKAVTVELLMSLIHVKRVDDTIEYKMQYGIGPKPFTRVRAIITTEFKEKGQTTMDDMKCRILRPIMLDPCEDDPGSGFPENTPLA